MDFTKAVAIFISGIFAPAMIDTLMCIAPSLKTGINAVLIRVNPRSRGEAEPHDFSSRGEAS
jgi:hypothetical protein